MRYANDSLIQAPVDLSNDWTSPPVWLGSITDYSIQLVFTGNPEGIFKLQLSNDKEFSPERTDNIVNFSDVAGSSQIIEESGDHTWDVRAAGYRWVRVRYIAAAGAGDLLGLKFIRRTGSANVVSVQNTTIVLEIEGSVP